MVKRILPLTVLAVIIMLPPVALGKQITVTVRNQPIATTAIVENGHVLLPLRDAFESLNSTVSYDSSTGRITARNILHTLHMRIGSNRAYIDGRATLLDAPPRVINDRAYVPVALAAKAMGAIIRFDPRANVLAVNGSPPSTNRSADVAQQPQSLPPPPESPAQGAVTGGAPVAANAVALSVDGHNVMQTALAPGRHTVDVMANTPTGRTVTTQWNFFSPGSPAGVVSGLTLVAPPTSTGFSQPPAALCSGVCPFPLTTFGSSGLFLTGDPLFPTGQVNTTPVFQPVFLPIGRTIIPFRP